MTRIPDVQSLYQQWQEGRLLDSEERSALWVVPASGEPSESFADLLRAVSDPLPPG
ncbi:MAG: hypothetical protein ACYDAG_12045 [Chloroflexota bacterium]